MKIPSIPDAFPIRVVYLTFMDLPSTKAHALQIVETCTALTHWGVRVDLVVAGLKEDPKNLWEQYGVAPVDGMMRLIPLRRKVNVIPLLSGKNVVAYTRSTRWARFLSDFQWLHKTPVVFETHRKSLYHRRDTETGASLARTTEIKRLEEVFNRVQGVICAHGTTWALLRSRGIKSLLLWYGWTHPISKSQGPPWKIGYASAKEDPLLLEAIKDLPGLELNIFGSSKKGENMVGSAYVKTHPFTPHARLMGKLAEMGIMVSLDEGIKLADYLSLGGAIVAPDLPSTREILGKAACYFTFGSSSSLALALKRIKESPQLFSRLKKEAFRRSSAYSWPQKAERINPFLEEILLTS